MICSNKSYENKYCKHKRKQGCLAMRIAGSGSSVGAVCDCVVLSNHKTYFVDVKSSRDKTFYSRKPVREQLEKLRQACLKHGGTPLLALRFKNRKWIEVDITKVVPSKVEVGTAATFKEKDVY